MKITKHGPRFAGWPFMIFCQAVSTWSQELPLDFGPPKTHGKLQGLIQSLKHMGEISNPPKK